MGGQNSIVMGMNATAEKDRSLVINLVPKAATSFKTGEILVISNSLLAKISQSFVVKSKLFIIRIGTKKAIINKNNIQNFIDLLSNKHHRRLYQTDEQQAIIVELQEQNKYQNKRINELQEQNEKHDEQ